MSGVIFLALVALSSSLMPPSATLRSLGSAEIDGEGRELRSSVREDTRGELRVDCVVVA